jgi:4-amino-4-deoxy-L-arabinose transferase-like glycosyltransferase
MDTGHCERYGRLQVAIVVVFLVVAVARIVSTYSVFSQTWDEPVHVASGMEWLQQGTYTYEDLHPPLARIAVAIGPYLRGIRLSSRDLKPKVLVAGGNTIFAAHGDYIRNLALSRLGVIPFFLLGVGMVWYWTRRLFGNTSAVAALGVFTLLPPVLGHAALATTDLPLAATFALALFAFTSWLEKPSTSQSLLLGLTAGLVFLTKFTALLFLPACGAAVLLCWLFASDVTITNRWQDLMRRLKPLGLAALICALVVSACYRFSLHPVTGPDQRPHQFLDHVLGQQGRWHDLAYHVAETAPVPVPEFFHGITQARARATLPTNMYLLGEVRTQGWWYFFPLALIVKTPIPFLIFMVLGALGVLLRWKKRGHEWPVLVPLASALALLFASLPTKFNIGLRHILPIYVFLSMLAGLGITGLWQVARARPLGRLLAEVLAAWMLVSTATAQPDYLAYFNEFAGSHPEHILVDSDLDWGQDLLRLSTVLHARRVAKLSIAYNGSADLSQMNLPPFEILAPCVRATGWVAVSLYKLQMSKSSIGCGGFSWLEAYTPVTLIGKSIRLYWVPNTEEESTPRNTVKLNEVQ